MGFTVTQELVDNSIKSIEDYKLGRKTTVVILTLNNGFEIVGTSACIDEKAYDHSTGIHYATEDAKKKIWTYLAFVMQGPIFTINTLVD